MSGQLASIPTSEVNGTNQAVKDLCNQQYATMNSLLQSYNLMTIRDANRIVEIAKKLEDTDAEMKSDMLGYITGGIGYVGDVYGAFGNGPKLTPDDYQSDLDAVNLSMRLRNDENAIEHDVISCFIYGAVPCAGKIDEELQEQHNGQFKIDIRSEEWEERRKIQRNFVFSIENSSN